ncbi:Uncharacterized protein ALO70_03698 [Pseudomonas amygdali pv. eriobotryae]|uniref:Uncharacterized protein n=1 Tax=Pseudomonas amygdali pv. eriobotryae TaxID=129137 RepID=A0A0P9Q2R0_PSEA0|nr:hypothetical protein [Pseudomonas amygdali]KPX21490.1 Uncharacterized protein ALO70_03698 [Pseudomonas amygdali pv. eriobotryae]KWS75507.1 hypothetical protein AL052_08685 [Pseudomonas amygdali pv. eriobotryae]RMM01100.1 hypothetical protein ALQ86_01381 [Pseudomonas amygdali pv. eriobotryae]RMO64438.1 hypothetical protein ALQ39_04069 [Pseudomonas amygdali pv. eriobotryae]
MQHDTPRKLNRRPLTSIVNINDIHCREGVVIDPIFEKKYINFLKGKKQALLTRLPLASILNGFYLRNNGDCKLIQDPINRDMVDDIKAEIRSGRRPALYICKNVFTKEEFPYSAPDDNHVYIAYQELEIHSIPVVLLEASDKLPESAFQVRHQLYHEENLGAFICAVSPHPERDNFHSILGKQISSTNDAALATIQSTIGELIQNLKSFHGNFSTGIHYHQTLFSILYRLNENIQAIRLLIENNFYYQAVALLRSIYEMSLDFYVDWLAPEEVGFWLQTHSRVNRKGFECAMELASPSDNLKKKKIWMENMRYCYDFLDNVSNKANLSPLGRKFYDEVYTFTSEVIHQDFNMTEHYALFMENPEHRSFDANAITTLVRFVDMIAGKVCWRVATDIGVPEEPLSE